MNGKEKKVTGKELLLQATPGFIELDEDETVESITQDVIKDAVDISSQGNSFTLKFPYGPYMLDYTSNGRHMLMAGRKGHLAAIDLLQNLRLTCEFHVGQGEQIRAAKWLHQETLFAVSQMKWTHIYDNQGLQIHCLKDLDRALQLEFLPFHFLLASSHAKGFLSWLDISVGKRVSGHGTKHGELDTMCQNTTNGVIHLGHGAGTVTLWTPNQNEFVAKFKCHGSGITSVVVDHTGKYMATSGNDRRLKIWDLRTYKELQSYTLRSAAKQLAFSQSGLLAASQGNIVEVYRDAHKQCEYDTYLTERCPKSVSYLRFRPFEDVLGVGHEEGFCSLIVPGAGEPNFDAREANPYQTKQQRREAEVQKLLEKIPATMVSLDSNAIGQVNVKTIQQRMEEKANLKFVKPKKIDFTPRYKKKGGSKAGKKEQRKQGVIIEEKLKAARQAGVTKQKEARHEAQRNARHGAKDAGEAVEIDQPVLNRFKKKKA